MTNSHNPPEQPPEFKRTRSWKEIIDERHADEFIEALDEIWEYCRDREDITNHGTANKYMRWKEAIGHFLDAPKGGSK